MNKEIEAITEVLQDAKFYVDEITEPGDNGTFQLTHGAAKWFAESLIEGRQPQPVTEPTFIENLVSPDFLEGVRHGVELEHGEVEAAERRIEKLEGELQHASVLFHIEARHILPWEECTERQCKERQQMLQPKDGVVKSYLHMGTTTGEPGYRIVEARPLTPQEIEDLG